MWRLKLVLLSLRPWKIQRLLFPTHDYTEMLQDSWWRHRFILCVTFGKQTHKSLGRCQSAEQLQVKSWANNRSKSNTEPFKCSVTPLRVAEERRARRHIKTPVNSNSKWWCFAALAAVARRRGAGGFVVREQLGGNNLARQMESFLNLLDLSYLCIW